MTRKSCYKPIKAFIYIEFLANDEDAMGNLITTNLAFRELENDVDCQVKLTHFFI